MSEDCEKGEKEDILVSEDGRVAIEDDSGSLLRDKHFGDENGELTPIEVLYLLERRGFKLLRSGKEVEFRDFLLENARKDPRILVKYVVYRDWRDRGVFPFEMNAIPPNFKPGTHKSKDYPTKSSRLPSVKDMTMYFFPETEMSIVFDREIAEELYYQAWFGQLGKYKQEKAGDNLSLDLIETLYLLDQDIMDIRLVDSSSGDEMNYSDLVRFALQRHDEIEDLLDVYSDWRDSGYIVKTGFKFGAHFRIYFPDAGTDKENWVHSKHVLHVFPKSYRMLMSEWGRIIRLSQSVRKTFILGVPRVSEDDYEDQERGDVLLYHRTKNGVEDPESDSPTFLCLTIPETLRMSGLELANALREAESMGLQLLIAVVDRETDINYYVARKIGLKGARNGYYEIYWYRP